MDPGTLSEAMGGTVSLERYAALLPHFEQAMKEADVTTAPRAAMWCAQLGHESVGLKYMEEIASGDAYEGRTDLGNTQPGDGRRFKGRGPIQVTGRANYAALSRWAHQRSLVPTPTFFVDNPAALASLDYAFYGAVWFWVTHDLNGPADRRDLEATTKIINGGFIELDDRRIRYQRCSALGNRLVPQPHPTEGEELDMASVEDINFKLDLILDQLAGPEKNHEGNPKWTGWPQLGNRTVVDALADIRSALRR